MKTVIKDLSSIPDIEWARLAAFIDGEGSIGSKDLSSVAIYVKVANCEYGLMSYLLDTFGGRVQTRPANNSRSRKLMVWIVDRDYAVAILKGCLPFFVIKSGRAALAIEIRSTRSTVSGRISKEIVDRRKVLSSELGFLNRKGPRGVDRAVGE